MRKKSKLPEFFSVGKSEIQKMPNAYQNYLYNIKTSDKDSCLIPDSGRFSDNHYQYYNHYQNPSNHAIINRCRQPTFAKENSSMTNNNLINIEFNNQTQSTRANMQKINNYAPNGSISLSNYSLPCASLSAVTSSGNSCQSGGVHLSNIKAELNHLHSRSSLCYHQQQYPQHHSIQFYQSLDSVGMQNAAYNSDINTSSAEITSTSKLPSTTATPSITTSSLSSLPYKQNFFDNKAIIRTVAKHFLNDERDRKYYADIYTCMPPPFFILTVTFIELIFFTYYTLVNQIEVTTNGPIPIDSLFIYRPDRKNEIWRFFLYMVLHAGWLHLIFNLLVQLLVGLPLEMVHGSARIGVVYMAGVLAGSLATSVFDPGVYLVGASGGVYALLAAHLSNVLLNYDHLELGLLRIIGVFIVASVDVGIAIYNRYAFDLYQGSVSYVAHLAGASAGLTIGLLVLKNFEQKLHEQLMWWVALGVYTACIIFALAFNIFN